MTTNWFQIISNLHNDEINIDLIRDNYFDLDYKHAFNRFKSSLEWAEVLNFININDHSKILDLGSGRALSSAAFAELGGEVTVVEPETNKLVGTDEINSCIQDKKFSMRIINLPIEECELQSNYFDFAYSRQFVHHVSNIKRSSEIIYSALKPGACYLATREHVIDKPEQLEDFLMNHPFHKSYGGENAFLLGEYINDFKSAGFRVVKILHPFTHEINLYPSNKNELKALYSSRIKKLTKINVNLRKKSLINNLIFSILSKTANMYYRKPGRLYSFLLEKPKI